MICLYYVSFISQEMYMGILIDTYLLAYTIGFMLSLNPNDASVCIEEQLTAWLYKTQVLCFYRMISGLSIIKFMFAKLIQLRAHRKNNKSKNKKYTRRISRLNRIELTSSTAIIFSHWENGKLCQGQTCKQTFTVSQITLKEREHFALILWWEQIGT